LCDQTSTIIGRISRFPLSNLPPELKRVTRLEVAGCRQGASYIPALRVPHSSRLSDWVCESVRLDLAALDEFERSNISDRKLTSGCWASLRTDFVGHRVRWMFSRSGRKSVARPTSCRADATDVW